MAKGKLVDAFSEFMDAGGGEVIGEIVEGVKGSVTDDVEAAAQAEVAAQAEKAKKQAMVAFAVLVLLILWKK